MVQVIFKRKTTAEINELPIVDGQLIWNTETGETYIDIGTQRILTGGSGANGKSAYEIWLEQGNEGTEEDFINYLKASGTTIYNDLENKPQINDIELTGNKTLEELGIQEKGDYALNSNIPTKVSELENDSSYLSSIPSEYVTDEQLQQKGYATENFVANKIAEAELSGSDVDLSGLATKDELKDKVDKVTGKSLIADTEIERLANVTNYNDTELRNEIGSKATISDMTTYIEEHKDELKGADGKDGENGKDGYTPIKGTDYWTEEDKEEIKSELSSGTELPDYWEEYLPNKIATIKNHLKACGKNGFAFINIADMHEAENLGRYTGVLAKRIMDECHIPYAIINGDLATRQAVLRSEMEASLERANEILKPINDRALKVMGNHDGSYGETAGGYDKNLSYNEIYDYIYRSVTCVRGGTPIFDESGMGYYIDDVPNKVRFVILSLHNNYGHGSWFNIYRYGQSQFDLMVEALTTIPSDDWGVVFASHIPPVQAIDRHADGTAESDLSDSVPEQTLLRNLVQAYMDKNPSFNGSFSTSDVWHYVNLSNIDFSNAKGKFIGYVSGHLHTDLCFGKDNTYNFLVITSRCDSYNENVYANNGTTLDEELKAEKVAGTTGEQSFDVFIVDKVNETINIVKIGAGEDRLYSFGDVLVTHSVTSNLSNAMLGNTATEVIEGAKYTATVSAMSGYKLLNVTVSMGGTDITSTAYSDGTINIDSVTGDIVINVTTEALPVEPEEPEEPDTPKYTNLADPTSDEWLDGYRITTGGEVEAKEGVTLMNTIPCNKGDVIRVKGVTTVIVGMFDETGKILGRSTINTTNTQFGSIVVDGDYNQFTIAYSNCKSIRFYGTLTGTAEDVIITVNQEIV